MAIPAICSDPKNKASYHTQKGRNAKQTRTPAQEMGGMGAEDVDAPPKAAPKAKPKASPKPAEDYVFDEDLFRLLNYDYNVLQQIEILEIPMSKAVKKRIQSAMDSSNYGKHREFDNVPENEIDNLISYLEEGLEFEAGDMERVADQWGMDLKMDDDEEFVSIKNYDAKKYQITPEWFRDFLEEQLKKFPAKKAAPKAAPKAAKTMSFA